MQLVVPAPGRQDLNTRHIASQSLRLVQVAVLDANAVMSTTRGNPPRHRPPRHHPGAALACLADEGHVMACRQQRRHPAPQLRNRKPRERAAPRGAHAPQAGIARTPCRVHAKAPRRPLQSLDERADLYQHHIAGKRLQPVAILRQHRLRILRCAIAPLQTQGRAAKGKLGRALAVLEKAGSDVPEEQVVHELPKPPRRRKAKTEPNR